ncbi:MAG: hypothetical protein L6Q95_15875 [Planctomycetes bacterium]|nr:hypothetical protein [Planctomycetota bacterium]
MRWVPLLPLLAACGRGEPQEPPEQVYAPNNTPESVEGRGVIEVDASREP